MDTRNVLRLGVALLLGVGSAVATADELTLIYHVDQTRSHGLAPQSRPASDKTRSFDMKVVLGNDYVIVADDLEKTVYDFSGARIHTVDLKRHASRNNSLYWVAGYRMAEYANCMKLRELVKVGLEKNADERVQGFFDPFDLEAAFACPVAPDADVEGLKANAVDNGTEFTYKDEVVTKVGLSKIAIPRSLTNTFSLWLVYRHPIHPAIRCKIETGRKVPTSMFYTCRHVGITQDMRLTSHSTRTGEPGWALSKKNRPQEPSDRLQKVVAAAAVGTPLTREQAIEAADKSLKDGATFDAMLSILEYSLQSGDRMTAQYRSMRDAIKADRQCGVYLATSRYRSRSEAEARLRVLDELSQAKLKKGYVLDILRGNACQALGQGDRAIDLFLGVLEENPFLAGVYKDLGQTYYQKYRISEAWTCWDAGRRISPNHPLLKDISDLEEHLRKTRPDHFLLPRSATITGTPPHR